MCVGPVTFLLVRDDVLETVEHRKDGLDTAVTVKTKKNGANR